MKKSEKTNLFNINNLINKQISNEINLELEYLKSMSNIPIYKNQIQNRKEGINTIINEFNYNLEIISKNINTYIHTSQSTDTTINYEKSLDKIIQKHIDTVLDKLYNKIFLLYEKHNTQLYSIQLKQINEKKEQIHNLLDNYSENIIIINQSLKKAI